MGGHRMRFLEPHRAFSVERIGQTSHLTLHGLNDELAGREVKVSHDTVWKFLRREGLRFKKRCSPLSRPAPKSRGGDAARRRRRWRTLTFPCPLRCDRLTAPGLETDLTKPSHGSEPTGLTVGVVGFASIRPGVSGQSPKKWPDR